MSNTSGALGFVQGLQGGMDFMDKRRRNKAIDKSIAQDTYLNEIDIASRKKDFVNEGVILTSGSNLTIRPSTTP